KCPYHGETVKDSEGKTTTKDCPTCGGLLKKQVVFNCIHPKKPMGEEVTIVDCGRCPSRPMPNFIQPKKLILFNGASPGDHLA
ncbi:hypothetical protein NL329_30665, partial [Klebsiella pneumoniae]|nr:hypothetical protein [Klebsiella pneumoniae]